MQIVGYESAVGGDAALLLADDGAVERRALAPGSDVDVGLGRRHCAGALTESGHAACEADAAPHCDVHTSRWPCARCRGDCDMPVAACHEDHAVYLAAFAPASFKVGVTRSWRLDERLREQGADRAAHIRSVEDGRRARRIEAGIAESIGDQVRVATKVEGIHRPVDGGAWTALLADFDPIETLAFDYGFSLSARPVTATMARGTVRGVQGRVLVLDRGDTTYAVDLRDLVGHEVRADAAAADRQASLGAFE
ncbi:MAG: DUF2797 domain-containing protein [Halobacteriaceae archaeon]